MKYYPAQLCITLFYKALLRTTKYFSVQSTINIKKTLQSTTQYFPAQQSKYYKVLQNTTPYCSARQSTTEHCSVLPPTNLFDSRNTWNVMTFRGANSGRQNTKEHEHSRVI